MRLLGVIVVGGCVAGAPTSTTPDRRCTSLEGTTFASLTEGECGLGPTGPTLCTWHVTFSAHDATTTAYSWQHSDYGQEGAVQCNGATVTEVGGMLQGSYDPAAQRLVWDGVTYAP